MVLTDSMVIKLHKPGLISCHVSKNVTLGYAPEITQLLFYVLTSAQVAACAATSQGQQNLLELDLWQNPKGGVVFAGRSG